MHTTLNIQDPRPCGRCENELPLSAFDYPTSLYCSECTQEVVEIIRTKYSAIEAAHFRAKLRQRSRELHARVIQNQSSSVGN